MGNIAEDDDVFEVRQTPFIMIPVWVQLNVSPMALATYAALATHINTKRGDRNVWPTQQMLAERLGLRNAKSIRPYLAELEELGAIRTKTVRYAKGMRVRTVYHLRMDPPPNFTGPCSLDEVPDSGGGAPTASTPTAGGNDKTAGHTEGCSSTPCGGTHSTPELYEEKLEEPPPGGTTTEPARPPAKKVTIAADTWPLTDAMRERITTHLADLHLTPGDVTAQHEAWVDHHAGTTMARGKAERLWWGWMCRAWRRCTDPTQMPITDADRAYAARRWPDIDLEAENRRFMDLARERDWRFSEAGWDRAWREHMQAAQDREG